MRKPFRWALVMLLLTLVIGSGAAPTRAAAPLAPAADRLVVVEGFMRYG